MNAFDCPMIARFSRGVVRLRLKFTSSAKGALREAETGRRGGNKVRNWRKKVGWLGVKVGDIKYASVTIRIMKEVTDKDGGG